MKDMLKVLMAEKMLIGVSLELIPHKIFNQSHIYLGSVK